MNQQIMKIEEVAISDINPSEYNPRAISGEALDGLKKSISRFGITQPLVVNRRTGNLAGGHQRLRAAAEMGFKTVPVIYVDLDENDEKLLNVVLNNKHIEGFFTEELQVVLEELKTAFGQELFEELKLEPLVVDENWGADLDSTNKINPDDSPVPGKITITCKQDDKDHLLIRIKELCLELSFEGVHVA